MNSPEEETMKRWQNDPGNWKYNSFYYNKQDPRIFVPKKNGAGLTPNFANPKSVIVLITLFIAWVILAIVWIK